MTDTTKLEPIAPTEAVETYLTHRETEVSATTLDAHRYRLQHFSRWCAENGIKSLSELNARDLQDYRHWRQQDGDLNAVSVRTQMSTFRVFIKWAEDYNAVPSGFSEHVRVPQPDSNARDVRIDFERIDAILKYLRNYEYASPRHTLFEILWHTGIRIGSAYSLDTQDYNHDQQGSAYLEVNHRPQSETPLKNKRNGERTMILDSDRDELLDDYIDARRHSVHDKNGRKPLFTTRHGRAHKTTLRKCITVSRARASTQTSVLTTELSKTVTPHNAATTRVNAPPASRHTLSATLRSPTGSPSMARATLAKQSVNG